MRKGELKKQSITKMMADFILSNGLQNASLRNLAIASNTSDRMLLHYFKDKNELFEYVLEYISDNFILLLNSSNLDKLKVFEFLPYIKNMIANSDIQLYIKLWIELISLSSREIEIFRLIGQKICNSFIDWIQSHLIFEKNEDEKSIVLFMFAMIEGIVFIDALGYGEKIDDVLNGLSIITKN